VTVAPEADEFGTVQIEVVILITVTGTSPRFDTTVPVADDPYVLLPIVVHVKV
jgi:hypothetical protein